MTRVEGGRAVAASVDMHAAPRARPMLKAAPLMPDIGDIRSLLLAMKVADRAGNVKRAESAVAIGEVVREEAADKAKEAAEQAKAAQEKGGFWAKVASVAGTVATVAAVVAAVASVVCTGGASAPAILALAGTLLSAGSPLIAKHAGEDAGKVAMYGGLALSLGAAAYSAAGKAAATEGAKLAAAEAGKAAAKEATKAAAAQAAKAAAATAANEAGKATVRAVGAGALAAARTTEGGARVVEGYARYRAGSANAAAEHARADQLAARNEIKRSQANTEDVIALLQELEQSVHRAMQTILRIGQDQDAVQQTLTRNIGRSVWA